MLVKKIVLNEINKESTFINSRFLGMKEDQKDIKI